MNMLPPYYSWCTQLNVSVPHRHQKSLYTIQKCPRTKECARRCQRCRTTKLKACHSAVSLLGKRISAKNKPDYKTRIKKINVIRNLQPVEISKREKRIQERLKTINVLIGTQYSQRYNSTGKRNGARIFIPNCQHQGQDDRKRLKNMSNCVIL